MRRSACNIAAWLLLLVAAAMVGLWARSYRAQDHVIFSRGASWWEAAPQRGWLVLHDGPQRRIMAEAYEWTRRTADFLKSVQGNLKEQAARSRDAHPASAPDDTVAGWADSESAKLGVRLTELAITAQQQRAAATAPPQTLSVPYALPAIVAVALAFVLRLLGRARGRPQADRHTAPRSMNLAILASLLLCVATLAVWTRSRAVSETWRCFREVAGPPGSFASAHVTVDARELQIAYGVMRLWELPTPRGAWWVVRGPTEYPPRVSLWQSFNGRFECERLQNSGVSGFCGWRLAVPHWALAAVLAVLPVRALLSTPWRQLHDRRCRARGVCPACSYDLRATPLRCPECGRATDIATARGRTG